MYQNKQYPWTTVTYYYSYDSALIFVVHSVVVSLGFCEVFRRFSTMDLIPRGVPTYGA